MKLKKLNSMQTTYNKSLHHMLQRRCRLHCRNLSAVLDKLNVKKLLGADAITGRMLRKLPYSDIL